MNFAYVVTSDVNALAGWTPKTLAEALQVEFDHVYGEGFINVECSPNQIGGGGLDTTKFNIDHIVERVTTQL